MRWKKAGLIFVPNGKYDWSVSHAQLPIAEKISADVVRIYFATRDRKNRSVISFIEVEAGNPANILYVHDQPALGLGQLGCFDDSGVMPACIINRGRKKYLYYTGWNRCSTIPFRTAIGLAVFNDDELVFEREFDGPIIDRSTAEPISCAHPCLLQKNDRWKMWYISHTKWEIIDGKPEAFYTIKYAESSDGINWQLSGTVCIDYDEVSDAIAVPYVWFEADTYKMLYSFRQAVAFRENPEASYRLGYAESADGVHWVRKDEEAGLERSDKGWDSVMIAYANLYKYNSKTYLLYNGNGFGASGIGYAIME